MRIESNKNRTAIIYDQTDWLTGLDKHATSAGTDAKLGHGFTSATNIDPLRKLGFLSTGRVPTDATNVAEVTTMLRNGALSGGVAYCIGGAKIHSVSNLIQGTVSTTSPFPYTVTHSTHTNLTLDDCCVYNIGTTKSYFYSYNDDTDWNVGMYNLASTFDDDYMTTVPTTPLADDWGSVAANDYLTLGKGFPHPLEVGDDDIMYIGAGRYLHGFDGSTTTFIGEALKLPSGWVITGLAKYNGYLAISAYYQDVSGNYSYKGKAAVWMWNYIDLDPTYIYDLEANYVSNVFSWNGTIACFTEGGRSDAVNASRRLKYLSGGKFETLVSFNSGLPIRGGSDVSNNSIYFNSLGKVYAVSQDPFTNSWSLNQLCSGDGASSGMCKLFFGSVFTIHLSSGAGTSGGLNYINSGYDNGSCQLKRAVLSSDNQRKYRIKSISIIFNSTTSGGKSLSMSISLDGAGLNTVISAFTAVTKAKMTWYNTSTGTAFGEFTSIEPYFEWGTGSGSSSSPIIDSLEIEIEPINI